MLPDSTTLASLKYLMLLTGLFFSKPSSLPSCPSQFPFLVPLSLPTAFSYLVQRTVLGFNYHLHINSFHVFLLVSGLSFEHQIQIGKCMLGVSTWVSHRYLKFNMYKTELSYTFFSPHCLITTQTKTLDVISDLPFSFNS